MKLRLQIHVVFIAAWLAACAVNITHEDGRACDLTHPCSLGRFCIEGQCRPDGYGLVGHWRFDEDSGNQALDSSGNNLVGVLSPGVRRVIDPQRGRVLSFDGSTATVTVRNRNRLLDVRNQFTIAAWLKANALTKYTCLVCRGWENDSNDHYNLGASNSHIEILVKPVYDIGSRSAEYPAKTPTDWIHAVGTYDGTAVRLFINGEQVATAPLSGEINYGTPDGGEGSVLAIGYGSNIGPSEYFNGLLDDVRFDDRAHSADEIRATYLGSPNR